jgi:hypothetical protein
MSEKESQRTEIDAIVRQLDGISSRLKEFCKSSRVIQSDEEELVPWRRLVQKFRSSGSGILERDGENGGAPVRVRDDPIFRGDINVPDDITRTA